VSQSPNDPGAGTASGIAAGPGPSADPFGQVMALLKVCPSARVLAGARDSRPVPVPQELPVQRSRCLLPQALDHLDPQDIGGLIEALDECRRVGYGRAELHFLVPEPEPVTIHIFDTCDEHEVRLCVLTLEDPESAFLDRLNEGQAAPRRLRMTQDRYATIVGLDESLERLLAYRHGEMVGHRASDYLHPDDVAAGYGNWVEVLDDPSQPRLQRLRYRAANGKYLWLDITFTNRLVGEGVIICACVDVTAEVEAQQRIAERARLLHRLTESLPLGVVQIDPQGQVCHANDRLAVVLGFALETDIAELADRVDPDQRPLLESAIRTVLAGEDVDLRVRITPPRGRPRVCQVNLRGLAGEDSQDGALICFTEVTEAVRLQQELERQATHDALSGCLNRTTILRFLDEQLKADAARPEGPAAVFVDLDHFKAANDRYGHAVGDEILAAIGGRLRSILRQGDAVGRLGGDEFLVVFRRVASRAEAERLGERVTSVLAGDVKLAVGTIWSSGSVGVSWSEDPDVTTEQIVAAADRAMYAAKRSRLRHRKVS
jgi:diguanylate cyclase (GGDEF)-like protein